MLKVLLPGTRDWLNEFENGKTQLFNSRGVGKFAYLKKKKSVNRGTLKKAIWKPIQNITKYYNSLWLILKYK